MSAGNVVITTNTMFHSFASQRICNILSLPFNSAWMCAMLVRNVLECVRVCVCVFSFISSSIRVRNLWIEGTVLWIKAHVTQVVITLYLWTNDMNWVVISIYYRSELLNLLCSPRSFYLLLSRTQPILSQKMKGRERETMRLPEWQMKQKQPSNCFDLLQSTRKQLNDSNDVAHRAVLVMFFILPHFFLFSFRLFFHFSIISHFAVKFFL